MSKLDTLQGVGAILHGRFMTLPVPTAGPEIAQQTFIVTVANTGLGFESTKHLSRLGAGKIIMAVRTPSKGEEAKRRILAVTNRSESSIEVWNIDMDSYNSVENFLARASSLSRIDGVLANAGLATSQFSLSEGGFEKTLNVNVIATFLLYVVLLPKMRESARATGNPCRFTIPNSALHYVASTAELADRSPGLLARLSDPEKALIAGNARYMFSKLLVLYAVREFAVRELAISSAKATTGRPDVIINTPNPSFCKSDLSHEIRSPAYDFGEKVMARSTEEGSRTLVHGVLAGIESHGEYLNHCHNQAYVYPSYETLLMYKLMLQPWNSPARKVTSKDGQEIQKFFFKELMGTLERIQPGISANI